MNRDELALAAALYQAGRSRGQPRVGTQHGRFGHDGRVNGLLSPEPFTEDMPGRTITGPAGNR